MYFGDQTSEGGIIMVFVFVEGFWGIYVDVSIRESFLILRERRENLLRPRVSFELAVLGLLVESLRKWRNRCAMCEQIFEFSGSLSIREREARKVCRKHAGSVVGHTLKVEACLPQKL